MRNEGLVSIIIPVFNVRPYLVEALDSVIHQSYSNLEIIIIDDGSTDGSGSVCDEYAQKDKRIHLIHQENKGLSNARNVGLDIMTGDVVAFLDSDDAYHFDYVETMLSAMTKEQADIVSCRYTEHCTTEDMNLGNQKYIKPHYKPGIYKKISALIALADDIIDHHIWDKLYKKSVWKEYRFPDGHVYEDSDAIFCLVNNVDKICAIDEPLYMYRVRPGSITETSSRKNVEDWISACLSLEKKISINIPDIFSTEQLTRRRQLRINGMIVSYARLSELEDEHNFCGYLREQIIQDTKKYGVKGIRPRIGYYTICLCPCILGKMYQGYSCFRRFMCR